MTGTRFPDYLTWSMFSNGVAYCVNAAEPNLASVSGRASLDWATCHGSCFFSFRSAVNVFTPKRERNSPEHSSLQAAININLDALVHDLHESGVVLIAENNRFSVGHKHVHLRRNGRLPLCGRGSELHEVPIRGGHIHVRAVMLLQIWCAAEVVGVSVRDDHDLHVCRIEAEFLHSRQIDRLDIFL